MNKKIFLLITSGVISISILIFSYIGNYRLCGGEQWGGCVDILADIETILLPFLPLLLFSLITYRMKEEIFQAWFRFVRIYIPIAVLLIALAPSYTHNWMFPYDKGMAAVIFSIIFSSISFGIVVSAQLKKK